MDQGFYGFVELGGAIPVTVQCADSNSAPQTPDSAPTVTIYNDQGSPLAAYTDTAGTQTDSQTGYYRASITASGGNGFESGKTYEARWEWLVSSAARVAKGNFTVV